MEAKQTSDFSVSDLLYEELHFVLTDRDADRRTKMKKKKKKTES